MVFRPVRLVVSCPELRQPVGAGLQALGAEGRGELWIAAPVVKIFPFGKSLSFLEQDPGLLFQWPHPPAPDAQCGPLHRNLK